MLSAPAAARRLLKMDYRRSDRVADLILRVLAEILRAEIRDPRLRAVSLTRVALSGDLRHARVFFNLLGGGERSGEALSGLKSAAGFIRSRLGKELSLRFVPVLEFTYDDSEDEARRIDALLKRGKD